MENTDSIVEQKLYFRKFLENIEPLTEEEWNAFDEVLFYKELSKEELLTQNSYVEKAVYFLLEGYVRVYAVINGIEHCTNFRFQHEFTSSITSFITRSPSLYSIQALSDLKVIGISYADVQYLYRTYPTINTIGRKIIEFLFVEKHNREISFLAKSAEERYTELFDRHPEFVENISVKHLASYLGIKPESLSRIRKSLRR